MFRSDCTIKCDRGDILYGNFHENGDVTDKQVKFQRNSPRGVTRRPKSTKKRSEKVRTRVHEREPPNSDVARGLREQARNVREIEKPEGMYKN